MLCFSLLPVFVSLNGSGQPMKRLKSAPDKVRLGAYYFDGWNTGSHHITDKLKNQFAGREPIWGWVTSTQPIIDAQIGAAAGAGIGFFAFDWYFRNGSDHYPLNHALGLYLSSAQKERLKFCLMVANHNPFFIGPDNWEDVSKIWLELFKRRQYLTVDGKPLLIFFETSSLVREFGSAAAVRKAFERLKASCLKAELKGVTLAACVYNNRENIREAEACGFDVLTGYNYHDEGLEKGTLVTPVDSMRTADIRVWNGIKEKSRLPYMPNITLNWDPRPWRPDTAYVPHFSGYSMSSVYQSVHAAIQWIRDNEHQTPKERIAIMYAWNENGEGGWLTPTRKMKDSLLTGVKNAVHEAVK